MREAMVHKPLIRSLFAGKGRLTSHWAKSRLFIWQPGEWMNKTWRPGKVPSTQFPFNEQPKPLVRLVRVNDIQKGNKFSVKLASGRVAYTICTAKKKKKKIIANCVIHCETWKNKTLNAAHGIFLIHLHLQKWTGTCYNINDLSPRSRCSTQV